MSFSIESHKIIERRKRESVAAFAEGLGMPVSYDRSQREDSVPLGVKNVCELTGAWGLTLPKDSDKTRPAMEAAHINHAQYGFDLAVKDSPEHGVRIESLANKFYNHPDSGLSTTPFVHYMYHHLANVLGSSHHIGLTPEQNNNVVEKIYIKDRGALKFLGEMSVEQAFRIVLLLMSAAEDYTGSAEQDPVNPRSPHTRMIMSLGAKHRSWFERRDRIETVSSQIPYAFKIAAVAYLFPHNLFSWDGSQYNEDSRRFIGFKWVEATANGTPGSGGLQEFRRMAENALGTDVNSEFGHSITPDVVAFAMENSLMGELAAEMPYLTPDRIAKDEISMKWLQRIQRVNENNPLTRPGEIFYGVPNPDIYWALREMWNDYIEKASENNLPIILKVSPREIDHRQRLTAEVSEKYAY